MAIHQEVVEARGTTFLDTKWTGLHDTAAPRPPTVHREIARLPRGLCNMALTEFSSSSSTTCSRTRARTHLKPRVATLLFKLGRLSRTRRRAASMLGLCASPRGMAHVVCYGLVRP